MLHQLIHPFLIYATIFLGYLLILLLIYPFAVVAKLKPNPPYPSILRVEFTMSVPAPVGFDPHRSEGTCITTTFIFADELAKTVTDFLAAYSSPSRLGFLQFLQQTRGPVAGLFITRQNDSHVRSLTLLGRDAEDVASFLAHCFNCQLASDANECNNESVSRTA